MTCDKLFGEKSGFDVARKVTDDLRMYYIHYHIPIVKRCIMTKSDVVN